MLKAFLLIVFLPALLMAELNITKDENDCIDGWSTMDIQIMFEEQSFDFDPPCNTSFSGSFTKSTGEVCKIEAGMCSKFEPKNRFVVTCKDKETVKVDIKCP